MSDHFDYIIIGGGVVGLCTAYNLTKVGIKPLIIEQFHLPHTRGSSHGQSRLLRTAHLEDSYTALCVESYKGWQNIEEEGEKQLIIATELLLIQDNYGESLRTTQKTMERLSLPHEWIDGKELRRRYPMLRYSESYGGVLDKTGSLILADKALHVLRRLVEKAGSEIRDGEKVLGIKPGQVVTIETSKAKYTCNKLFIATGPWSKEMTDSLGLNLPLSTMDGLHLFWRAPTTNPFVPGRVPIIYDVLADNKPSPYKQGFFSLLPTHEYPGLVKTMPGRVLYWNCEDASSHDHQFTPTPAVLHTVHSSTGYCMVYSVPMYEYPSLIKTMDGLHLFWRAPTTNPFVPGRVPIIHDVLADNKPSPYKQGFFLLLPTHEYPGLVKTMPGRFMFWEAEQTSNYDPKTYPLVADLVNMENMNEGHRFFMMKPPMNKSKSSLLIIATGPAQACPAKHQKKMSRVSSSRTVSKFPLRLPVGSYDVTLSFSFGAFQTDDCPAYYPFTPEQVQQLSVPVYKNCKDKKKDKTDKSEKGYNLWDRHGDMVFTAKHPHRNLKEFWEFYQAIVTRGEPPPFYCHPDERDKYSMQPMVDLVADYIKEHFPGVQTKPSIAEPCMYCLTPDKNGIVDRHPKFPNILFGIAFSGRGYMLAPIVGKVLTDLAMDRKPSVDMSPFAIGRFAQKSNL